MIFILNPYNSLLLLLISLKSILFFCIKPLLSHTSCVESKKKAENNIQHKVPWVCEIEQARRPLLVSPWVAQLPTAVHDAH
jgi:hypothetical protein